MLSEHEDLAYSFYHVATPTSTNSDDKKPSARSGTAASARGIDAATNPTAERRFRCEAHTPPTGDGNPPSPVPPSAATAAQQQATPSAPLATPLFAFELEVHGAAEWAGAAAAQAAVQVWARLEEGGDRGAFQRMWEALQQDVLRQNRHWRREMSRARGGGGRGRGGREGGGGGRGIGGAGGGR